MYTKEDITDKEYIVRQAIKWMQLNYLIDEYSMDNVYCFVECRNDRYYQHSQVCNRFSKYLVLVQRLFHDGDMPYKIIELDTKLRKSLMAKDFDIINV